MGWSKKDYRKRRTGYVLGSLDRAMEHVLTLKAEFDAVIGLDTEGDEYIDQLVTASKKSSHAKLAFMLLTVLNLTLQAQKWMERYAEQAYGTIPDKVERWTKTGEDWRKAQESDE